MSWIPPDTIFSDPVSTYVVTWRTGSTTVDGSTSIALVGGLNNGTHYTFSVAAIDMSGLQSRPSQPSNSVMPQLSGTSWSSTGAMHVGRAEGESITRLRNGKVLVAGGKTDVSSNRLTASAELYNPASGKWSLTGTMTTPRAYHTATLLPDGKVLVAGGSDGVVAMASAELYDPGTGTWSPTGAMQVPRFQHIATMLPSGKVLVAGGQTPDLTSSAELYDPGTGTWSLTGSMNVPRILPTATLLANGDVLAEGGGTDSGVTTTAELYRPDTGAWTMTGSMANARWFDTATLLPSGKVLVAGGTSDTQPFQASAELYDPASGTWATTGTMAEARGFHVATLLPNGTVLVAGGTSIQTEHPPGLATAEIYDPGAATWSTAPGMTASRFWPRASLLPSGAFLVTGGSDSLTALASAELYGAPRTALK